MTEAQNSDMAGRVHPGVLAVGRLRPCASRLFAMLRAGLAAKLEDGAGVYPPYS
jgi:hypothetical protein